MSIVKQRCLVLSAAMLCGVRILFAQGVSVKAHVVIEGQKQSSQRLSQDSNAVLWLTPSKGWTASPPRSHNLGLRPQLVQKNKQFIPHVLVVEVGSVVDFPNH